MSSFVCTKREGGKVRCSKNLVTANQQSNTTDRARRELSHAEENKYNSAKSQTRFAFHGEGKEKGNRMRRRGRWREGRGAGIKVERDGGRVEKREGGKDPAGGQHNKSLANGTTTLSLKF